MQMKHNDKTTAPWAVLYVLAVVAVLCACGNRQGKGEERALSTVPPKKIEAGTAGYAADSLCIVLSEKATKTWLQRGQTYHALTREEVARVDSILRRFWTAGGGDTVWVSKKNTKTGRWDVASDKIRKPLPYGEYWKQLVGYEERGLTMVRVQLSATVHPLPGEDIQAYLKHHLYVVNDGGKRYGSVLVDLTHGKVVELSLNGEA